MKFKQYLIYKVSGGLNHMLNQINNSIHLAKQTNRFLIIDCNDLAFNNDFNKYFNIPNYTYSTNYNILYDDTSLKRDLFETYINAKIKYTPKAYFLLDKNISISFNETLENNEQIIYCSWIRHTITNIPWYIKVNKNIIDIITKDKINDDYIGVHYRNTDRKHDINTMSHKINELKDKTPSVYLATDDYTAYNKFKENLPKFEIIQYTIPYDNKGKNIHYGNPNKDEIIMNALIDMYHLTYATYFIPSENSSFSKKIIKLRKKDEFFI